MDNEMFPWARIKKDFKDLAKNIIIPIQSFVLLFKMLGYKMFHRDFNNFTWKDDVMHRIVTNCHGCSSFKLWGKSVLEYFKSAGRTVTNVSYAIPAKETRIMKWLCHWMPYTRYGVLLKDYRCHLYYLEKSKKTGRSNLFEAQKNKSQAALQNEQLIRNEAKCT